MAVSPDSRFLAAGGTNDLGDYEKVILWDIANQRAVWTLSPIKRSGALAFTDDSKTLLVGNAYGEVTRWKTTPGTETTTILDSEVVSAVTSEDPVAASDFQRAFAPLDLQAFSPDTRKFAEIFERRVQLKEVNSDREIGLSREPIEGICQIMKFSPDGKLMVVTGNKLLRVLDSTSLGVVWDLTLERTPNAVAFSSDNTLIATSDHTGIKVWELNSHRLIKDINDLKSPSTVLAFAPDDGFLLSGHRNGEILSWYVDSWEFAGRLNGHKGEITSVVFSGESKLLVTGSDDETVKLWDASFAGNPALIKWADSRLENLVLSSDGTRFAVGVGKEAQIWETASRQKTKSFIGTSVVLGVALSPDQEKLAVARRDGLTVWNVNAETQIMTLTTPIGSNSTVSFSANGNLLGICTSDGAEIWELGFNRRYMKLKDRGTFNMETRFLTRWQHRCHHQ